MRRKIGARELAEIADVSVATVSRVLNDKPGVSDDTRKKILRIMREYGYRPQVISNRSEGFGLIILGGLNVFQRGFFSELLEGLTFTAFRYKRNLTLIEGTTNDLTPDNLSHKMRSNGLSGFVVIGSLLTPGQCLRLAEFESPLVVVGGSERVEGCNWVGVDHFESAYNLIKYLTSIGHKRIGFVMPSSEEPVPQERFKALMQVLKELDLKTSADWTYGLSKEETLRYMGSPPSKRPTVLVGLNDESTIFSVQVLQDIGLRVPEDVSVVGFSGSKSILKFTHPAITTITIDGFDMGRRAVELLFDLEEEPVSKPIVDVVETNLIIRDSTSPIGISEVAQ